MTTAVRLALVALPAILLAATPGPAADPPEKTAPGTKSPPTDSGQKAPSPDEPRRISGRVVDTARMAFHADGSKHLLAVVRLDDGKSEVVDLGPAAGPGSVTVKVRDYITVTGRTRDVVQHRRSEVFFADRLTTGDQTLTIYRPDATPAGPADSVKAAAPDQTDRGKTNAEKAKAAPAEKGPEPRAGSVSGTVRAVRSMDVSGGGKNLVALVRTRDDHEVVVDLGDAHQAAGYGVEVGSLIQARGPVYRIQDRPVVVADMVSANGTRHTINRSEPAAGERRAAQP